MIQKTSDGFTLIEMSIVLVIIGLITGGALVGQDLINAAAIRAQITQIEKYNTAVNTFRSKYSNFLPGDIPDPYASQFGFTPRGQFAGQGDGNDILEGVYLNAANNNSATYVFSGEIQMFWVDLSQAGLVEGGFTNNNMLAAPTSGIATTQIPSYFPAAKLGAGNFIYAWSGGWRLFGGQNDGVNYYSLGQVLSNLGAGSQVNVGLTVQQAYNIDKKVDDGLPQSGRTIAGIDSCLLFWAIGGIHATGHPCQGGGGAQDANGGPVVPGDGVSTAGSSLTCYDNSASSSGTPGVAGATEHYSIEMNGGGNVNCALSFQFQ